MRKLTILLSAVAWLMAMPVMADEETTINNVVYFKDGEVAKVKNSPSATGEITIESSVTIGGDNLTVWGIEHNAFENNTSITKVTIPSSVEYIGYSAFYGCTKLVTVDNKANITQIENYVFSGCNKLENCNIPSGVENIGQSAFEGCSSLKALTILGSVGLDQYALKDCSALKSIYYCGSTLSLKPTVDTYKIFENTNDPVIYTKTSALSTIKDALNGKADWIKDLVTDEIPFTMPNEKQYVTFCRDFDVDFSAATGLKAGVALSSTLAGNKLSFSVKSSVPAGTGVLLKGTAGATYTLKIAEESPEAIVGNLMKGVVCPTAISQIDGGNTNFVLNGGVFKKVSANNNTLAAGKAYLQLPNTSSAREISFIFDDETTGISATLYDKGQMTNDKAIYNLNGQRVAQPTKGMYIINGNKVIVK